MFLYRPTKLLHHPLVSPIAYLVWQTLGFHVHKKVGELICPNRFVYYAGDLNEIELGYFENYKKFVDKINQYSNNFKYFIKFDIKDFFNTINLNILMKQILNVLEQKEGRIIHESYFLKDMIRSQGDGRFPTIQMSPANSYLASIIYLDTVETQLINFLNKLDVIDSFIIVRYVDDTYILVNSENRIVDLYHQVKARYSLLLKQVDLTLNNSKCAFGSTSDLGSYIKYFIYNDSLFYREINLTDELQGISLLPLLNLLLNLEEITYEDYFEAIRNSMFIEGVSIQPGEILNELSFAPLRNDREEVKGKINQLLDRGIDFVRLDPSRITRIILNTRDGNLIRKFLTLLFNEARKGFWAIEDGIAVIQYMTLRGFMHPDLLELLKNNEKEVFNYIKVYCQDQNWAIAKSVLQRGILNENDFFLSYLYGMYLFSLRRADYSVALSYYKSFIERYTSALDYVYYRKNSNQKRKNKFHNKKPMLEFFKDIEGSNEAIKEIIGLRNQNPVNHSASMFFQDDDFRNNSLQAISAMQDILCKKVNGLLEDCSVR